MLFLNMNGSFKKREGMYTVWFRYKLYSKQKVHILCQTHGCIYLHPYAPALKVMNGFCSCLHCDLPQQPGMFADENSLQWHLQRSIWLEKINMSGNSSVYTG